MGEINILKAGYEKKVGQTYGVAKKGLYVIKAVPFSHTPHNDKQVAAKNEFIGLNRIASQVVKKMWNYLNLSDKKMYRNNALCQLWKGALKGDVFSIENLKEVISQDGNLTITEIDFDYNNYSFVYIATDDSLEEQTDKQIIYLAVVTDKWITKADITGQGNFIVLQSIFDVLDFAYFQIWAFKAVPNGKKWLLKGLSITDRKYLIIVNGVFYTDRWQWLEELYIENKILYLPPRPSYISNGILFLE